MKQHPCKLLPYLLVVCYGITAEETSTPFSFRSVFRTPKDKVNYDDFEILERSSFHSEGAEKPPSKDVCVKECPKASANAQIHVRIGEPQATKKSSPTTEGTGAKLADEALNKLFMMFLMTLFGAPRNPPIPSAFPAYPPVPYHSQSRHIPNMDDLFGFQKSKSTVEDLQSFNKEATGASKRGEHTSAISDTVPAVAEATRTAEPKQEEVKKLESAIAVPHKSTELGDVWTKQILESSKAKMKKYVALPSETTSNAASETAKPNVAKVDGVNVIPTPCYKCDGKQKLLVTYENQEKPIYGSSKRPQLLLKHLEGGIPHLPLGGNFGYNMVGTASDQYPNCDLSFLKARDATLLIGTTRVLAHLTDDVESLKSVLENYQQKCFAALLPEGLLIPTNRVAEFLTHSPILLKQPNDITKNVADVPSGLLSRSHEEATAHTSCSCSKYVKELNAF